MKKLIVIILVIGLIYTSLFGCSSESTNNSQTSTSIAKQEDTKSTSQNISDKEEPQNNTEEDREILEDYYKDKINKEEIFISDMGTHNVTLLPNNYRIEDFNNDGSIEMLVEYLLSGYTYDYNGVFVKLVTLNEKDEPVENSTFDSHGVGAYDSDFPIMSLAGGPATMHEQLFYDNESKEFGIYKRYVSLNAYSDDTSNYLLLNSSNEFKLIDGYMVGRNMDTDNYDYYIYEDGNEINEDVNQLYSIRDKKVNESDFNIYIKDVSKKYTLIDMINSKDDMNLMESSIG